MTLNKQHFLFTLLAAAATTAFGILLIAVPGILNRICLYTGILFCAVGVVLLLLYFIRKQANSTHLVYGIISVVIGVLLCIIPGLLTFLIPILFGLWILGNAGSGLFKNLMTRSDNPFWWLGSLLCVAAIALGVFVITRPADAMQKTVSIIGIAMTANGVLRMISAILGRKVYLESPDPAKVIDTTIEE
ncbi:MAG: DUF308 domain-containing protein [Oscillospiraceae bacterium]|nr:DUF308 domain-containing protein [Oscillospiraceae bacterium]